MQDFSFLNMERKVNIGVATLGARGPGPKHFSSILF